MKLLSTVLAVCFLVGCSSDKLVEITHLNSSKDTVVVNASRIKIKGSVLQARQFERDANYFLVDSNVKYYRILD